MKVIEIMGVLGDVDTVIGVAVFVVARRGRFSRLAAHTRREIHRATCALDAIYRADRKLT